jgi:ankyrin repeat protein
VNLLLNSGSDITHRDGEGSTPLHRAVRSGHFDIVRLLLRRGADINIRDSGNETPLDLARNNGRPEVVRLLEVYTEGMYSESQGRTDPPTALNQASHDPPSQRSLIRRRR